MNKKALDQYVNFSEQRDELARRRDESHAAEAKIRQLITTLDMRKDEAIERTFKARPPCRPALLGSIIKQLATPGVLASINIL